jgi:magnesium transporter
VATELQTDLEELEAEVFSPDGGGSRHTASRIYSFKRQVLEFRRATGPLTLPLTRLAGPGPFGGTVPFVNDKARPFFRDISDHLARVNESVEGLDRLVSDILSAHLAQMSVRQNDDMRKISAWAAMAAVPTMIAGIYGMNFDHMPELHWLWSYPAVIGAMAVLEVLLYRLFKSRGWL